MAYSNSADPDQTEGAVWSVSTLFAIPPKYFKKQLYKKTNLSKKKKAWNKMSPYFI